MGVGLYPEPIGDSFYNSPIDLFTAHLADASIWSLLIFLIILEG